MIPEKHPWEGDFNLDVLLGYFHRDGRPDPSDLVKWLFPEFYPIPKIYRNRTVPQPGASPR